MSKTLYVSRKTEKKNKINNRRKTNLFPAMLASGTCCLNKSGRVVERRRERERERGRGERRKAEKYILFPGPHPQE